MGEGGVTPQRFCNEHCSAFKKETKKNVNQLFFQLPHNSLAQKFVHPSTFISSETSNFKRKKYGGAVAPSGGQMW